MIQDILISIFASYLFILLLKLYFLIQIFPLLGKFVEDEDKNTPVYDVKFDYSNLISPLPRICLSITRVQSNNEDWSGLYYSDMLNPHHLTGAYVKKGNHESQIDKGIGWHDIILFPDKKMIAFTINYIHLNNKERQWFNKDGFFIIKRGKI